MEQAVQTIETLVHQKIMLFQELVETLGAEKKYIEATDVDALWRVSEKKHALATEIESTRSRILDELGRAHIAHDMSLTNFSMTRVVSLLPSDAGNSLKNGLLTLSRLKDEVAVLGRANKEFVSEYLQVLDELIGIIANSGASQSGYGRGRYADTRNRPSMLIHREV